MDAYTSTLTPSIPTATYRHNVLESHLKLIPGFRTCLYYNHSKLTRQLFNFPVRIILPARIIIKDIFLAGSWDNVGLLIEPMDKKPISR